MAWKKVDVKTNCTKKKLKQNKFVYDDFFSKEAQTMQIKLLMSLATL